MWRGLAALRAPRWTLVVVSCFTGLSYFKPSEPFLVAFLECVKSVADADVVQRIFPLWTYAYLGLLPVLCLFAELIGYRAVVLLGAVGRLATCALLLSPVTDGSVPLMQVTQALVAAGFASEPALYAAMYAALPPHAYARASGLVSFSRILATMLSSLLGQLMIAEGLALQALVVVSTVCSAAALLVGCALAPAAAGQRAAASKPADESVFSDGPLLASPSTPAALGGPPSAPSPPGVATPGTPLANGGEGAASRGDGGAGEATPSAAGDATEPTAAADRGGAPSTAWLVAEDTLAAMRRSGALRYYGWLAVATAAHQLLCTYWQNLPAEWSAPPPPPPGAPAAPASGCASVQVGGFNGYTQAVASSLGGLASLLPMFAEGCATMDSSRGRLCTRVREALLIAAPLAMAALLYALSAVRERLLYGAAYVLLHVIYEAMRVVCLAEGARCVAGARCRGAPRFALVSGLVSTVSLGLQALLLLAFGALGSSAASVPLYSQFRALAAMLLLLFVGFASAAVWRGATGGDASWPAGRHTYPGGEGWDGPGCNGSARASASTANGLWPVGVTPLPLSERLSRCSSLSEPSESPAGYHRFRERGTAGASHSRNASLDFSRDRAASAGRGSPAGSPRMLPAPPHAPMSCRPPPSSGSAAGRRSPAGGRVS